MRKFFAIALAAVLLSVSACQTTAQTGGGSLESSTPTEQTGQSSETPAPTESEAPTFSESETPAATESETPAETESETPENSESGTSEEPLPGTTVAESALFGLISELYQIKQPELMLGSITVDLQDQDNLQYYTGLTDSSLVKDVAVSEAMMSSQAYSLVLVQVKDPADAKLVAEEMLAGIDPVKWICVEADDLQIVTQGDIVMLFMVSSSLSDTVTSQDMVAAFEQVRGAKPDLALKK